MAPWLLCLFLGYILKPFNKKASPVFSMMGIFPGSMGAAQYRYHVHFLSLLFNMAENLSDACMDSLTHPCP